MDDYYNKYYKLLEGAKILKFVGMQQEEYDLQPFPVFLVRYNDVTHGYISISMDEEGNGGGFIFMDAQRVALMNVGSD